MAINFSKISSVANKINNQNNEQRTNVRAVTQEINSGLAQFQRLTSQAGNVDIYASQLTNGFKDLAKSIDGAANTAAQIAGLSGQAKSAINNVLADPKGSLGQFGSSVVNTLDPQGSVRGLASGQTFQNIQEELDNVNLQEFASNVINVATRETAELASAIGGTYDSLRQLREGLGDLSGLDNFILPESPGVASGFGSGAARSNVPNPLRNHNHFNYIITLGILSIDDYHNPDSYRNRGTFINHIIRSGGGDYAKRYKVLDESSGNDAEYFLDDLELDAVIAPNQNTSVALGTNVSFTVVEPYSMGNFIQALIGSAKEVLGEESNYIDAPFCLRFDFVGWDEYGERSAKEVTKPCFVPIKITKIDFNVSGQGSTYQVQAVPYSEYALNDAVNETKTPINAVGNVVWQLLNGEDLSVTSTLNQRKQNLEDNNVTPQSDRYIIAFPRDLSAFKSAIAGQIPSMPEPLTIAVQTGREQGTNSPVDSNAKKETSLEVVVTPKSQLFEFLENYSRDTSKMNAIGTSTIVEDTAEGGDQKHADLNVIHDEETDTHMLDDPEAAFSEKAREHKFHPGEKITQMIESVILRSQYAIENATKESAANGTKTWFKIDTQVFIDTDLSIEARTGTPAKIFVYSVIPYFVDEAKFLGPTERPQNTEGLKASAAKEYNYIYTGQNEDILDFDITFNNSFMMNAFGNFGQNPGGSSAADKAVISGADNIIGSKIKDQPNSQNTEISALIQEGEIAAMNMFQDASRSSNIALNLANQFHYILNNQTVDMATAEIKIFGDPFFIPQQTGNFYGSSGSSPNMLQEGTMNYMNNEVFIVVNFKTPFDYQVEGATMEMPKVVKQFSGLFSVWAVTNTFTKGRFEQTLKLIRRRGQDDPATTGNNSVGGIVGDNESTITDQLQAVPFPMRMPNTEPPFKRSSTSDLPEWAAKPPGVFGITGIPSAADESSSTNVSAITLGPVTFSPNNSVFPSAPKSPTPVQEGTPPRSSPS